MRNRALLAAAVLVAASLAAACESDQPADDGLEVTSQVVSDETTKDILLVEPDAEGSWPVVLAMHGIEGKGQDMAELATRLARDGVVVFAPTYHTDWSTEEGLVQAANDAECGYRFARSIAADHGGDLDQPVTFVGWSLGATAVLSLGLSEEIDPTGEFVNCFSDVPRPDVIVAISGCYYEYEGRETGIDTSGWGNEGAHVVLVGGGDDTICAAWQTERAASDLRGLGYDVDLVMLGGANHFAPIFHDFVDGEWVVVEDDPAGDRTVDVILDAIAASQGGP